MLTRPICTEQLLQHTDDGCVIDHQTGESALMQYTQHLNHKCMLCATTLSVWWRQQLIHCQPWQMATAASL